MNTYSISADTLSYRDGANAYCIIVLFSKKENLQFEKQLVMRVHLMLPTLYITVNFSAPSRGAHSFIGVYAKKRDNTVVVYKLPSEKAFMVLLNFLTHKVIS